MHLLKKWLLLVLMVLVLRYFAVPVDFQILLANSWQETQVDHLACN